MKRARILFYVTPKFKWKYLANWLISVWTRSKYSHCEIHDPRREWVSATKQKEMFERYDSLLKKNVPVGTMHTATMRGEDNGTVCRPASEVLTHPENWRYIEIEIENDTAFAAGMAYMDYQVKINKGYSRWDLLKFISPIHFPDNKRNICSEFCHNFLYYVGIFKKKGIVSPKKLHKKLTKLGYKAFKLQ